MPQPIDPFPIYKDGQKKVVHGVDYAGWAARGWTLEPGEPAESEASPAPDSAPPAPDAQTDDTTPTTYADRQSQLEAMLNADQGWRNIQQLAKDVGITEKPAGGWADAIPLILEKEGFTP